MPIFIILYFLYLYKLTKSSLKINNKKEESPIRLYIKKYVEDFNKLELKAIDKSVINIKETVEDDIYFYGRTILYYNSDNEEFNYNNNRGALPYKTLESLVRKYAITYDRKALYVCMYDELNKSNIIYNELLKRDNNDVSKDNVFVSLKSNNITNKNLKKKLLIKDNVIKFKYVGKIDEYNKSFVSKKKYNYSDYINEFKK